MRVPHRVPLMSIDARCGSMVVPLIEQLGLWPSPSSRSTPGTLRNCVLRYARLMVETWRDNASDCGRS